LDLFDHQAGSIDVDLKNAFTDSPAMRRVPLFADNTGDNTFAAWTLFGINIIDASDVLDGNLGICYDADEVRYIYIPQ
jgi:hypothetical protein